MAQGYARSTGKVGVCMATSGPGAMNLLTTIADAYMDSVPMVAITGQVFQKLIGKSLDAKLTIYAAGDELELLREFSGELATICIVSQVIVSDAPSPQNAFACADHPVGVVVGNADGEKCDRCWMYTTDVTDDGEGRVCRRCKKIVG